MFSIRDPEKHIPDPGVKKRSDCGSRSATLLARTVQNQCFNQCCGSMTFWCGSGSGSGSADPRLWLMDPGIWIQEAQKHTDPQDWFQSCFVWQEREGEARCRRWGAGARWQGGAALPHHWLPGGAHQGPGGDPHQEPAQGVPEHTRQCQEVPYLTSPVTLF